MASKFQSPTLSWINPKIKHVLPIAVVHDPTRFHGNHSKTFRVIPPQAGRQTSGQTEAIALPPN